MLSFILGLLIGIFIWMLIDEYVMRRNSKFPSDEEMEDMLKEHKNDYSKNVKEWVKQTTEDKGS